MCYKEMGRVHHWPEGERERKNVLDGLNKIMTEVWVQK